MNDEFRVPHSTFKKEAVMANEMRVSLFPNSQTHQQGLRAQPRAALRVEHLTKYFDNQRILDNINFSVAEGESLVLLGPSGSGKSTTLRILAGLETPDSGEIFLNGRHIAHLRARDRNVGVIFQHYALFPRMSVLDNIAFGLKIRRVKKRERYAKAEELLALIGLSEHRDKFPGQLSGGQQQRVAIARAIAYQPHLLLFDESFSALDPQTRVTLRREIRALLQRLRIPAIFITHDQEEAMELGDKIAILNRGQLEQVGSPREVYDHPQTEFVATFLGAANVVPGTWRGHTIELDCERFLVTRDNVEPVQQTEVKVVFRPEDIVLAPLNASPPLQSDAEHPLGRAEVVDVTFTGAAETLLVRLLPKSTSGLTLAADHGTPVRNPHNHCLVKVNRSKWDADQLRLQPGDQIAVSLRQFKILR
jgi:ABC-type Fe3+/spermidine/putrescine transport system ATPase subunit